MHLPHWVEEHPWETAAGVLVVGLILVYMLFGGKSSSSTGSGTSDIAAYYAANAANTTSGNQLMAVQAAEQAQTTQALAGDQAMVQGLALQGTAAQNIAQIQGNSANYTAALATIGSVNAASIANLGEYWAPFLPSPGSLGFNNPGAFPAPLTVPGGTNFFNFGGNGGTGGPPTIRPDVINPTFPGGPSIRPDLLNPFGQISYNA